VTYFAPCSHCGKAHARMLRCPNQAAKVVPSGPAISKPGGKITVAKMPKPPSTTNLVVANAKVANAPAVVANTKHGKYADADKRRAYQAELMRKRRAAKKAAK
jgi:hypothetical protein